MVKKRKNNYKSGNRKRNNLIGRSERAIEEKEIFLKTFYTDNVEIKFFT